MENSGAYVLRENTGTNGLERTVRSAVTILANHSIPHLIAGGLAVQEHGYFRVTLDADIIVPDVLEAVEWLTADLSGPFEKVHGIEDTVRDKLNHVQINFLPAGRSLRSPCKVPFPLPNQVSEAPLFVSVEKLISLKLDSWINTPTGRLKDKADVIELIKVRNLSRDLKVDHPVQDLYIEIWDALKSED